MVEICPCKGCQKRYPLCHAECPKYIGWRKKFDAEKAQIERKKALERL